MGYGNIDGVVLQVRLAVVVVREIDLLLEKGVQEGAHGKALLAQGFAADEGDFLHLVGRGGAEVNQLLLRFRNLPHSDCGFVFKFFL